jgi:hypothetical protein
MKKVLLVLVLVLGFTSCINDESISNTQPVVSVDFTFLTTQNKALLVYYKANGVDENSGDQVVINQIKEDIRLSFYGNSTLDCDAAQTAAFDAIDSYLSGWAWDETTIRAELSAIGLGC